jgi:bacillithiol system protein YtxJ
MSSDPTYFRPLVTSSDWSDALEASDDGPVVVFKHSAACPTSARANREMMQFADERDVPVYRVVVQESRPVSDTIEDETGVRHETPQVLVLRNRAPVFDASHYDVNADRVHNALQSTSTA